jgi:hypothetical protein
VSDGQEDGGRDERSRADVLAVVDHPHVGVLLAVGLAVYDGLCYPAGKEHPYTHRCQQKNGTSHPLNIFQSHLLEGAKQNTPYRARL